jgi:16S rRNA (cytosine967-C5)-methyltransferase
MSTPRKLALSYLGASIIEEEAAVMAEAAALSTPDRALFQELSHGTLREWFFLEAFAAKFAKRPPKGRLRAIVHLSAYQLLFLDRIPAYAVFSEAAALLQEARVTESEAGFAHALLKSVERGRDAALALRAEGLEHGSHVPAAILDALTVAEGGGKPARREARARAVRAAGAMREKSPLVGYRLPTDRALRSQVSRFQSEVAPRALLLTAGEELAADLASGALRVQGEASQWACELASEHLGGSRVLEMAAGKGGKLLGTLAALTARLGGDPKAVPKLSWTAVDSSSFQLELLERDVAPVVARLWPQVELRMRRGNWQRPLLEDEKFDLVWLDAPCTGLGTLSKHPRIALRLELNAYEEAKKLALLQRELAEAGLGRLGREGRFFYTVCTLTRPETVEINEFCSQLLGRPALFAKSLWPGSAPAPRAEGFHAFMI